MPTLFVRKKDGTMQMCINYRLLNKMTTKIKFLLRRIDDLMDQLQVLAMYPKINMRSGYQKIQVRDTNVLKTTFYTRCGHYEFLIMLFGLTKA